MTAGKKLYELLLTKPSLQNFTLLREETEVVFSVRDVHNTMWVSHSL